MKLKVGIFFDGTSYSANNLNSTGSDYFIEPKEQTEQTVNSYLNHVDKLTKLSFDKKFKQKCIVPKSYRYVLGYETSDVTSNIWTLYNLYKRGAIDEGWQIAIYVNGCGTEDNHSNDLFTMTTGWSLPFLSVQCGVIDKTDKALILFKNELELLFETSDFFFDTIEFELFGFSRGSASARHFANRIRVKDKELLRIIRQFFSEENYPNLNLYPAVRIAFIGLFDTVAAILALSEFDFDINSSNTGDVNVELAPNISDNIFHITAAHEVKYNFSLNRVLPNYVAELELPGCHVDIGGGHPEVVEEALFISEPFRSIEFGVGDAKQSNAYLRAEQEYNTLINHPQWGEIFKQSDVEILFWCDWCLLNLYVYQSVVCIKRKQVFNGLEKISLNAMHHYARLKGCQFQEQTVLDIPEKISNFSREVIEAVTQLAETPTCISLLPKLPAEIARDYVHCEFFWSEATQTSTTAMQSIDFTDPEFMSVFFINRPTENLVRTRYDSYGALSN